jgi:hypothetical protein
MQNNESNELKVLVDFSNESTETDETPRAESDKLRTKKVEEIQGKFVDYRCTFRVPVKSHCLHIYIE